MPAGSFVAIISPPLRAAGPSCGVAAGGDRVAALGTIGIIVNILPVVEAFF